MSNTTFGGPLASRYAVSHNGWMTEESFVDWLKALFIPSLPPTRPVLLILDGHKSHITYEVRELARDNNIHLLKLPPHTTHLLQLLDIGVFNLMKGTWQTAVADFTRRERRLISKSDFPRLLKQVWESFKSQWAVSAFSKTGIVPFNPNCIPDESFKLSEPFTLSEIEEPSNRPLSQSTVLPPLAEPQSSQSSRPVLPSYTEPQSSPPSPFVLPSTQPLIEPPSSNHQTPSSNLTPTNSLNLSIDPPPPTNEHSDSPSISNETPATNGLTDHLNISSSSDSRIQSVRILSSPEYLRDFFADILKKESPLKNIKQRRKQLTGHGESLTSDEAVEVLRKEEEKKRLAAEKAEKKRQREEKRREKQEKKNQSETSRRGRPKKRKNDDGDVDYESTKKRKNNEDYETIKKRISGRPKKSDYDKDIDLENKENEVTKDDSENEDTNEEKSGIPLAICPSCDDTDDDRMWVACEYCDQWYHADCLGYSEWTEEEIQQETFICPRCI